MKNLVSADWLLEHINDDKLVVLDASQGPGEYGNQCIPGARIFDIKNDFSDPASIFPNTFPQASLFQENCRKIGIYSDSLIVVYDNQGIFSSPRAWWMFKTMGHKQVAVLDGGLPDWIARNLPTETHPKNPAYDEGNFVAQLDSSVVKDYSFVKQNKATNSSLIIDARSEGRFNGTAPEPRKGLKSGNIPGSINLPYNKVLNNNRFKSKNELRQIFDELTLEDQPLTFSCGSGITACIILLAAELAEMPNKKSVYDGSWTEWAELEGLKE